MTTNLNKLSETTLAAVENTPHRRGVTLRSCLLGLLFAVLFSAVMPYNDYFIAATYLSGNFFPIDAFAMILLLVVVVNPLLIRFGFRSKIFTAPEIITVWTLVLVVAGIPSAGLMRYLIPHIIAPHYYASASNNWDAQIVSHLPQRLLISDPTAVKAFFEGLKGNEPIPWHVWTGPLLWWSLFVICLFTAFFCLSTLLRRQWVDNERFAFPLVRLPVLMSESPEPGYSFNSLLRSPILWIGFGLVTALHTTKGLHLLLPSIPNIPTSWSSSTFLVTPPWNGMNDISFTIFPLVIGFTYLMSTDVSLSIWLFYLVFKFQCLLATQYNWDVSQTGTGWLMGPGFAAYEEVGGAFALALWTVWSMRDHLRRVWKKAAFNAPEIDDSAEPLSYRFALFGLAAAYAGMFLWLTLVATVQPLMAFAVLSGSLMVFIMLSWLVAQAGMLFAQHAFSPAQILTVFTGTAHFTAPSLAMSSMTEHVGWQDAREFMMPPLLNSFKASSDTGLSMRSLTRVLALSVVLAVIAAGWASIWLPYTHHGGSAGLKNGWTYVDSPQLPFSWTSSILGHPKPPQLGPMLNVAGGALFCALLFACRTYFPAFGLHPVGFLVAATYPMYTLWFSIFLSWLIKIPIMRYGGMKGYRALLPFFFGLIMGDTANAILWAVIGLFTKTGYALLPG